MLAIQQFVIAREQNILESGDCSAFYKYVNRRRIHREGVAPLANKYGKLATSNNEKAEILNSQFSSVFTTDDASAPMFNYPVLIYAPNVSANLCANFLPIFAAALMEFLQLFWRFHSLL